MELAHSLLLNEDALAQITEAKRPVFIFEWLRFLDKVLVAANKVRFTFWHCGVCVLFAACVTDFYHLISKVGCKGKAEEAGGAADRTH